MFTTWINKSILGLKINIFELVSKSFFQIFHRLHLMTGIKMWVKVTVRFLKKVLIVSEMRLFRTQNNICEHFSKSIHQIFLKLYLIKALMDG